MRLDPSLNVMPEESFGDLPTAINEEGRKREHQVPDERPQGTPFETLLKGTPDMHLKVKPKSKDKRNSQKNSEDQRDK